MILGQATFLLHTKKKPACSWSVWIIYTRRCLRCSQSPFSFLSYLCHTPANIAVILNLFSTSSFRRSIWLFRLQIHPIRSGQRSIAILIAACRRKQGRPKEDPKGEASTAHRNPTPIDSRSIHLQARRKIYSHLNCDTKTTHRYGRRRRRRRVPAERNDY